MSDFTVHVTDDDGTDYEYPTKTRELADYIAEVTENAGYTSEVIEN